MFGRLHIEGVSASLCLALAAALSAEAARAEMLPDSEGRAAFFSEMRRAAEAASLPDGAIAPEDPFTADCFAGHQTNGAVSARASVLLVAAYEGGYAMHGTGTIIAASGQGGSDRVLTAAHVVPPFIDLESGRAPLLEVMAFSSEGRLEAFLRPVVAGSPELGDETIGPKEIAKDLAVLEVAGFTADEAGQDWNRRGVAIASDLPDRLQMVTADPERRVFNKGASGAGILDGRGELVAVASFAYWSNDEILPSRDTGFIARASDDMRLFDPFWGVDYIDSAFERIRAGQTFLDRSGGALLAVPPVDANIRNALTLTDIVPSQGHATPAISGTIAGYPSLDCRIADVRIAPTDWLAPFSP